MSSMTSERLLIAVVDDDESIRESLPDLLQLMGYAALVFSSAEEFLAANCVDRIDCLLLDIAMPGMSGPDLHRALTDAGKRLPIIYITANEDETIRARSLALGAVDCLFKPFTDTALKQALDAAFRRDASHAS
jgi:FixJ family two-component response regulator